MSAATAHRLALGGSGLLGRFNAAGVLDAADVHVSGRLGALTGEADEASLLAAALCVRGARRGSVCVDVAALSTLPLELDPPEPLQDGALAELPQLDWPEPGPWVDAVAASPLVREGLLHLEGGLLYLDRYWREEVAVCGDLVARVRLRPPELDGPMLERGLARVFPTEGYDEQRDAVRSAATRWTAILTGGPGTGKTTAVAGLLALLAEQHEAERLRPPRIALCAPTGKAAARLQHAVAEATAVLTDPVDRARLAGLGAETLHRLLGWRPGSSIRFRHDRANPLPYDVVVVDEASMVSLTMMARLLEALRPGTRLVLVGDPDQLASVEAGAVLADLVGGFEESADSPIAELTTTHRFGDEIGALAQALRVGDAEAVLTVLGEGRPGVRLVDPDGEAVTGVLSGLAQVAVDLRRTAEGGDARTALATLGGHRLLCAHRRGPYGVAGWNHRVERLAAEATGLTHYDEWYAGRPILLTANDRGLGLHNGDTGVAVRHPDGRLRVHLDLPGGDRVLAPTRLSEVETMHALTVHKAQGSQAREVTVVLPPEESRLLTRELFYTAVTRAQDSVTLVGTRAAVEAAVLRTAQRASGLAERLKNALADPPPA